MALVVSEVTSEHFIAKSFSRGAYPYTSFCAYVCAEMHDLTTMKSFLHCFVSSMGNVETLHLHEKSTNA